MAAKKPKYQIYITNGVKIGSALLVISGLSVGVFDWLNYSLTWISFPVALILNILIGLLWLSTQKYLKYKGVNWVIGGKIRTIKKLGQQTTQYILAIAILLWVGPFANYINSLPAFKPAADYETLIVISKFQLAENVPDSEAYLKISNAIKNSVAELKLKNIRVEIDSKVSLSDNDFSKAAKLGKKYNATIVIWGSETRVDLTVNFYNLKAGRTSAAQSSINELIQPDEYPKLIVQYIPSRINFLALLTIGDILQTQGEYNKAIEIVQSALKNIEELQVSSQEKYSLSEAYFRLGSLYNDKQEYTTSIDAYSKAIQIYPYAAHTYNNRGTIRMLIDDYENAKADFYKAIELDPNYAIAYNNLASTLSQQKDYQGAIEKRNKAIELWPEYSNAYAMRGQDWYILDENDLAIKDITTAIEMKPNDPMYYLIRANIYLGVAYLYDIDNYSLALEDINKAMELDPINGNAYYMRYQVYEAMGEFDKANADLIKATQLGYSETSKYSQELNR